MLDVPLPDRPVGDCCRGWEAGPGARGVERVENAITRYESLPRAGRSPQWQTVHWSIRPTVFECAVGAVTVHRPPGRAAGASGRWPRSGRRRPRSSYRRWEGPAPRELWQLDVTGSVCLVAGAEVKVVTRVDDHSRSGRRPRPGGWTP